LPARHITSAVKAVVMARKRRPAPKYPGALAQRIDVGVDQIDRIEEVLRARLPEKIHLLFKHYKIDPTDEQSWQKLALQLAFDHVPGLQLRSALPPPKVGRKPTWKTGLGDKLVRAVQDHMKSKKRMRIDDAIDKLQNDKSGIWKHYTVENLGARYREAKHRQERFRKLVEKARELRSRGVILDGLLGLLLTDEN
jgi:hypothetical protein